MDNIRIRQILAYLKARKSCTLKELMDAFGVSSATIHRDVAILAKRDAVERVRGGLIYNETPAPSGNAAAYQEIRAWTTYAYAKYSPISRPESPVPSRN